MLRILNDVNTIIEEYSNIVVGFNFLQQLEKESVKNSEDNNESNSNR
jgi:hypothetical protein